MLVCASFVRNCTRDRGCSEHPVFPAPSLLEGEIEVNLGRSAPRDREGVFTVGWVERSETHRRAHPALMGIAALHPSYGIGITWNRHPAPAFQFCDTSHVHIQIP